MGQPSTYTQADIVVMLYFGSMGFTNTGLASLLEHKGLQTRNHSTIRKKRNALKSEHELWDLVTLEWKLYEVGRYLSGIMSDPNEFRDTIAVGTEEESIYLASFDCYLH